MSEIAASVRWDWPRISLGAIVAFLSASLLLAGAIHICAILLVPKVARTDGWSRLAPIAGNEQFAEIRSGATRATNLPGLDPLFVNGACRLQLAASPVAITVQARDRFWSLALYDSQGVIVFSLNDRTAVDGRLDMMVVNPAQSAELKLSSPAAIEQMIVVEGQSDDLVALLRFFAPTDTAKEEARATLAESECLPTPLNGTE